MIRGRLALCGVLGVLLLGALALEVSASGDFRALTPASPSSFRTQSPTASPPSLSPQRALLNRYCVGCHNDRMKASFAGLALDVVDEAKVGEHPEIWEKVVRKLGAGLMPPAGRPRPDKAAYESFVTWAEAELDRAAAARPNPGRTESFHRLNRAEYRTVLQDLLALDIDVTSQLPVDDASYGFDNIAGVLKINQSVMDQYLAATPAARTVWDGVYTDLQATRGGAVYANECALCHLADLRGEGFAPALIEDAFRLRWQDGNLGDLVTIVKATMPQDRPASLSADDYAAVVAYLLKMNAYPAGPQALDTDAAALKTTTFKKR